jgi:competence protein ComEC
VISRFPALVVGLAWSAAIIGAVVLAPSQAWIGAASVALAVPCLALALVLRPAVIALAVAAALLGIGRAELPPADPGVATRAVHLAGQTATIIGRLADDSRPAAGGAEALVEPELIVVDGERVSNLGNFLVRWRGPDEAGFGDQVTVTGKLVPPRDMPGFDRRAYLAQRHAYLEVAATSIDVRSPAGGLYALPGWLRARYIAVLDDALPPPHAAILLGVVLGIRRGIPTALENSLIATGLIHLLVLSGLKVAVFARIVQGALRPLLGRHATWPAICLVGLYALVGGATPAAIRAAAMGGLAIAASSLGRPSHVWTSLVLAAASMLGWRPELAWDVGFQLSFAGTAAIILLTPAIEERLGWLPSIIKEPFAVTCAAQVGTLPMMATDFHVISPVGPVANAVTLPILPILVAAGLLIGPLAALPELARVFSLPLTGLLAYIEQVSYVLARIPMAALPVPRFPAWAGVAYYSALTASMVGIQSHGRRRVLAAATAVVAPAVIAAVALGAWANAPPQVSVLAVGDGQAVLFRSPQGSLLVDGGPSPARLKDELGQILPPWQHDLDAVAITAPSLGHVGGLAAFDRSVGTVLIPDSHLGGAAWRAAAFEAAARGARVRPVHAGEVLNIAGFAVWVIAPELGAPGDEVGAAYLGLRVVAPSGRTFCDLSDLDTESQAIAAARMQGPCTYLLLPSGGRSLLSPGLERAAHGAQLIASQAEGRLARGFPPTVLRTDEEGSITLPM